MWGLVVAGGLSSRMGRDKGRLPYAGEPQALRAWRLLTAVCGRAFVSVRPAQYGLAPYRDVPCISDDGPAQGPAAGLLAAWAAHPDVAWLVLAADMPLVDESLLSGLLEARDPAALATAFRHPDGTLEPLCTIWEPAAAAPLRHRAGSGRFSLRELLESAAVVMLEPARPERLASVDTAGDYARVRRLVEPTQG